MSKTKLVTITCWAISALALAGFVIWLLLSNISGFGFGMGTFHSVGTYRVSAEDIDSLSIDWTAGAVYIRPNSGDEIQITEFAQRALRDGEALSLNTDGGTLTILFTEHMWLGLNNMPPKQLEILIPYALIENFEQVHVNTVSGRVMASGIHANDVVIGTTSGRIELSRISAPVLHASTTSGRIELSAVQADEIHLHTVSGHIETTSTQTETLRTNTTSGRHELSGSFGYINARSVSGRIEIASTRVPESLTARATSGRIYVTVPSGDTIIVQYSTTSGRFTSELPVITHSGTDAQFNLSTTSGRISLLAQ